MGTSAIILVHVIVPHTLELAIVERVTSSAAPTTDILDVHTLSSADLGITAPHGPV